MNVVMLKALYFRVGMDTGVGGCTAPIFEDKTFEYIPIPDLITTEKCTFSTCKGRHGKPFGAYLPSRLHDKKIHYDPDFRSRKAVYGDGTSHQKKFQELNEGDILAFYAGLTPWKNSKTVVGIDLYWIGYIIVDEVVKVDIDNILDQPPNAHSKRFEYIKSLSEEITDEFEIKFEDLLEKYSDDEINYRLVEEGLNQIKQYRTGRALGHSTIKDLDKRLEKILDRGAWGNFVVNTDKSIVVNTYFHLLDCFSKFTLVKGTKDSRLLGKAVKISSRSTNRSGRQENIVSDELSEILGIPKGLSLQRKNPRFVPNPVYNNKGDVNKLKKQLLNSE